MSTIIHGRHGSGRTLFMKDALRSFEQNGFAVLKSAAISRKAPFSAVAATVNWLLKINNVDDAASRLESLYNQRPGKFIDSHVKNSLFRLLLKQKTDGKQMFNRSPSFNSILNSALKSSAKRRSPASDMVELAASLVQLALDSSKDRFKGNIAIIVIEEHQLFDNASKCLLRILMQETYQIRLIFFFTSTEPKSTMVPYGFPFKHQVQLEPFSRQDGVVKLACGGNEHKQSRPCSHNSVG